MEQQGDTRTWRQENRDKQCERESVSQRETHTHRASEIQRDAERLGEDTHTHRWTNRQTNTQTKEKQAATERIQEKQRIKYWETGKNRVKDPDRIREKEIAVRKESEE